MSILVCTSHVYSYTGRLNHWQWLQHSGENEANGKSGSIVWLKQRAQIWFVLLGRAVSSTHLECFPSFTIFIPFIVISNLCSFQISLSFSSPPSTSLYFHFWPLSPVLLISLSLSVSPCLVAQLQSGYVLVDDAVIAAGAFCIQIEEGSLRCSQQSGQCHTGRQEGNIQEIIFIFPSCL